MSSRPATWKIVTFGVALTGVVGAGVGIAAAQDDGPATPKDGVSVVNNDDGTDAPAGTVPADASPESADSPNESATDSPADASPESADSPNESAVDSPADASPDTDSPDDTDSPS